MQEAKQTDSSRKKMMNLEFIKYFSPNPSIQMPQPKCYAKDSRALALIKCFIYINCRSPL